MYVIHLKKIFFILATVFIVSIISLSISQKKTEKSETVAAVALPVNNKVIILDARTWWRRWSAEQAIPVYQKQI